MNINQEINNLLNTGKADEARNIIKNELIKNPNSAELYNYLGATFYMEGNLEKAIENYKLSIEFDNKNPFCLNNIALCLLKSNELERAENYSREAISYKNDFFEAFNTLGLILTAKGELNESIEFFKKSLKINPDFFDAYVNIANSSKLLRDYTEAEKFCLEAQKKQPLNSDVLNLLGSIYYETSELDKSIKFFDEAIQINPNNSNYHNNKALLLRELGNYEEAKKCLRKSIFLDPRVASNYNTLGIILKLEGHHIDAYRCFLKALIFQPQFWAARSNFSDSLRYLKSSRLSKFELKMLTECIKDQRIDHGLYTQFLQKILIFEIKKLFKKDLEINQEIEVNNDNFSFLDIELITNSLKYSLITNLSLENFFKQIRFFLLNDYSVSKFSNSLNNLKKRYLEALSLQCFFNEHIWNINDIECKSIEELSDDIYASLDNNDENVFYKILLYATYKQLINDKKIKEYCLQNSNQIPDNLVECFKIILFDQIKETELEKEIKSISSIENEVSKKVKDQYEERPYPRWRNINLGETRPYISHIKRDILPNNPDISTLSDNPKVLIAGCGTGKHPLSMSMRYANSNITGLDLSFKSLSYAYRKMIEGKIKNVELIQGDILDAGNLNQKYEVIETVGVLHHMEKPEEGLDILLNQLVDGGYIKIGLYSKIARKKIADLRKNFSEDDKSRKIDSIRDIRSKIIKESDEEFRRVALSSDFFTTSTFIDLLLHAQEINFTIPEIKDLILRNNLSFLGFQVSSPLIKEDYLKKFPEDKNCLNLDNWNDYENHNNHTFAAMYQFWCKKN